MRFFSGLIIVGIFSIICMCGYALAQYPGGQYDNFVSGNNVLPQPPSIAPMVPVVLPQHQQIPPNFQQNPGQMPPPNPIIPPHESFREGWEESWVHKFRPLKEYDNQWRPSYNSPNYQQPVYTQPLYNNLNQQQWYYNPLTGNYQRNVCPQPQYYYTQPRNCWNW